jgi:FkbM family methyltransferase
MEILYNYNSGSGIFVQIGAGAGDLDTRANCRDGFTEFIKSLPKDRVKKLILVEPNPVNIPFLQKCWKDYPQAVICELAIIPESDKSENIDFYYSIYDGPHYQVASIKKQHVLNHYYNNDKVIESFLVPAININKFLNQQIGNDEIELLALDIEGIDTEIILDINFIDNNIKFLSFEYIHMGDKLDKVNKYLNENNLEFIGKGIDHNDFDHLYKKIS